jgi:hypothetical protein
VITFILQACGIDVPAEIATPAVALLTLLAGYLRGDGDAPGKHATA